MSRDRISKQNLIESAAPCCAVAVVGVSNWAGIPSSWLLWMHSQRIAPLRNNAFHRHGASTFNVTSDGLSKRERRGLYAMCAKRLHMFEKSPKFSHKIDLPIPIFGYDGSRRNDISNRSRPNYLSKGPSSVRIGSYCGFASCRFLKPTAIVNTPILVSAISNLAAWS